MSCNSDGDIEYLCQRCTACCRWPGHVKITDAEIAAMAEFLGMPEFEFIQRYTHLRTDRRGLSLIEHPDGSCIFLEGNDCAIQPVKPQQCRDFPNQWNFPGWRDICQAIPAGRKNAAPRERDGVC
jgi:uncharacterized protein